MPPPRRAPKPATPPTELQHQSVQEGQPPAPPSLPPATEAQFSWVPLADVKKWDKNPRDNRAAIPKVAASIRRFGVVSAPVVWTSQGRLVAGHTRVAAMELILSTDPEFVPVGAPAGTRPGLVPIRFHEFASEAEATAYAIADNRLGELAQWDSEKLPELLGGLDATLAGLTGFSVVLPVLDLSAAPAKPTGSPEASPVGELVPPPLGTIGATVHKHTLRYKQWQLPMQPEDAADFDAALERYIADNGSTQGFVRSLLGAVV